MARQTVWLHRDGINKEGYSSEGMDESSQNLAIVLGGYGADIAARAGLNFRKI